MKIDVEQVSPVFKRVTVEAPAERVEHALQEAYREVSRGAKIKGFRPGKVPMAVLKARFAKAVHERVAEQLRKEGLAHAIKDHELMPVSMPEMDTPPLVAGEPYTFETRMEVRPEVTLPEYKGLEVTREIVSVEEKDVDDAVENMRQRAASLAEAEDRPVKERDLATIDFECTVDGETFEGGSDTGRDVWVGIGHAFPDLSEALKGAEKGVQAETEITIPEDFGVEGLRGKTAKVTFTVNKIKEVVAPELDDELARDLEYEDLADLKAKTRENLEKSENELSDQRFRRAVLDQLVQVSDLEVPPSLIRSQAQALADESLQRLALLGNLPKPPDRQKLAAGFVKAAEDRVKTFLLIDEIAKVEEVTVEEEDIRGEMERIALRVDKPVPFVRSQHDENAMNALEDRLKGDKTIDIIVQHANAEELELTAGERRKRMANEEAEAMADRAASQDGDKADEEADADVAAEAGDTGVDTPEAGAEEAPAKPEGEG